MKEVVKLQTKYEIIANSFSSVESTINAINCTREDTLFGDRNFNNGDGGLPAYPDEEYSNLVKVLQIFSSAFCFCFYVQMYF